MKAHTYFAYCPVRELVKIGQSNDPRTRLLNLSVGKAAKMVPLWIAKAQQISEKAAHQMFASQRVRGEWFSLEPSEVLERLTMLGIEKIELPAPERKKRKKLVSLTVLVQRSKMIELDRIAKQRSETRTSLIRAAIRVLIQKSERGSLV